MQQTEKYGFNLIETGDAFSAEPLNENARKMAEALAAKGNCTVLTGEYVGTGEEGREIYLGFAPKFVVIYGYGVCFVDGFYAIIVMSGSTLAVKIPFTETGFQLQSASYTNKNGTTYRYVAFG